MAIVVEHDASLDVEAAPRLPRDGVGSERGELAGAAPVRLGRAGFVVDGHGIPRGRGEVAQLGRLRGCAPSVIRAVAVAGGPRILEGCTLTLLGPQRAAHGVVQVGQLLEHPPEDAPDRLGQAIGGLEVDLSLDTLEGLDHGRLNRTQGIEEHREGLSVTQDRPAPRALLERLERHLSRHLIAGPGVRSELLQLGHIVDDGGAGPAHHRHPPALGAVLGRDVERELDPAPQGGAGGDGQLHAFGPLGGDKLRGATFDDLDAVVAPGQGGAPPGP